MIVDCIPKILCCYFQELTRECPGKESGEYQLQIPDDC